MQDLIDKAAIYQEYAATLANAHFSMADYCRRNHLRLGVLATSISTLVGTAVFAGLVTQLRIADNQTGLQALRGWLLFSYLVVALFSVSAPVLTGLQTFLKYSEQAEKHKATATAYSRLRQQVDIFRLRLTGESQMDRPSAFKEFQDIVSEFGVVAENSPPLPDRVYDAALAKRDRLGWLPNFTKTPSDSTPQD
jgi:hypothetical protein